MHKYGASLDTITCMSVWDDDDLACPSGNLQHLCGVDGDDDLGHHDGLHVCGWCGAENDGNDE